MRKHRGSGHEQLIIYTVEITRAVRRHNLENYASRVAKVLRDLTTTKSVHGAALIHRPRGTWPRPLLLRREGWVPNVPAKNSSLIRRNSL